LCAIPLLLALAPVAAEDLLEVYRYAAESDPILRQSAASRLAQRESEPQAKANLLPSLDFSARTEENMIESRENFNTNRFEFRLSQTLYNRDRFYQLSRSKFVVKQADADYYAAEQDLILRTAARYFALLDTEVQVAFRLADKRAVARQLEQAQRRFEVGLVTITDVLEAQARFDQAVADEIVAVNDREDAREGLRELTEREIRKISFLSEALPLVRAEPHDVAAWLQLALDRNPGLIAQRNGVKVASEDVQIQRSGHYPTLDAVATYFDDNSDAPNALDLKGGTVGLRLNLPIYAGGAVISRTRQAVQIREEQRERLEEQTRNVERRTRDAFRDLDATISFVNAISRAVASNESSFEATEAGYQVGTRTIVDVLNSQRDLLLSQRDFEIARDNHVTSRLRLKGATGILTVADLEDINQFLQPEPYEWLVPQPDGKVVPERE
jgi:outer membrane protein